MKVKEIVKAAKQLAEPSEGLWGKIKAGLCMEVPLSQGYVALVDPEDYERVMQFKWTAKVDRYKDGTLRTVYGYKPVKRPMENADHRCSTDSSLKCRTEK